MKNNSSRSTSVYWRLVVAVIQISDSYTAWLTKVGLTQRFVWPFLMTTLSSWGVVFDIFLTWSLTWFAVQSIENERVTMRYDTKTREQIKRVQKMLFIPVLFCFFHLSSTVISLILKGTTIRCHFHSWKCVTFSFLLLILRLSQGLIYEWHAGGEKVNLNPSCRWGDLDEMNMIWLSFLS